MEKDVGKKLKFPARHVVLNVKKKKLKRKFFKVKKKNKLKTKDPPKYTIFFSLNKHKTKFNKQEKKPYQFSYIKLVR